jgi:hypothetical protein
LVPAYDEVHMKNRLKYEKPVLYDLTGEALDGHGARAYAANNCGNGHTASGACNPGHTAVGGECHPGHTAGGRCVPGHSARRICRPGNSVRPS